MAMVRMNLKIFILSVGAILILNKISNVESSANSGVKVYEFTQNASLSFPGKQLVGHVLEEFSTKKQVIHCAYECLKRKRCKSFNYGRADSVCQLNDATHQEFQDSWKDDTSGSVREYHLRDAFSIDEEALGPCARDPCQNDGRCLDTMNARNERTYYCICRPGWEGTNCTMEAHRIDWAMWSDWGTCSVTCGTGWTTRRRACVDTVTKEVVSVGECYGSDVEYDICKLQDCPRWEAWGAWDACSTENTCGSGVKVRERVCSNGGTVGMDRYCLGYSNETAPCSSIDCRGRVRLSDGTLYGEGRIELFNDVLVEWSPLCVDSNWDNVSANIVCTQIGFLGSDQPILDGRYGTSSETGLFSQVGCTGSEKTIQECPRILLQQCDLQAGVQCKVRGGWNLWIPWSDCSVTCENGTRTRTRECNFPPPLHKGRSCPGDGIEYKDCTEEMCPSISTWADWGPWSNCDVTCGEGVTKRSRVCTSDILPCIGTNQTFDICTLSPCSVDGVWATWTAWSECDVTCANGTRFRTRTCTGPFYGGAECPGDDREIDDCFPRMCEVDGVWDDWSPWTQCSTTCGYGNMNRSRTCYGPFYGGRDCPGEPSEVEVCNAFSCPVDGQWRMWTQWDQCSVSCGGGSRNRSRECNNPIHGGTECPGPSEESEPCNEHPCPIDGVFTEWVEWSECSVTCANGTRHRERGCTGPFHGGDNCTGNWDETEACFPKECPVDGVWQTWEGWQACNVTCGGGTRFRTRLCNGPFYDGLDCVGEPMYVESCNDHECPIDGVWQIWSDWTTCSLTCGGGIQNRSRECTGPYHGGADCVGSWNETQDCNTEECPVDGDWTIWTTWTECNVTCGGGTTWRTRKCVQPLFGGADCDGPAMQSKDCNSHNCPVDGVWTAWSNWTDCSLTCGNGSQTRERTCDGPLYGGLECPGPNNETRLCNTFYCPVDGVWVDWSAWGACSKSCGRGERIRTRDCDGPFHGGANCTGEYTETEFCATSNCPVDAEWLTWGAWSVCSTSCENGTASRIRQCNGPYHGGNECEGSPFDTQECFLRMCPVDGAWSSWGNWTECPVMCAGGIHNRSRECLGTAYGGDDCEGDAMESRDCNTAPCPVDGHWALWSKWSVCNVTCGGGTSDRYRVCTEGQHGGSNCTGSATGVKTCNDHECPIDGVWDLWSNWTMCTVTCGTGTRDRFRNCTGPFYGGQNCSGADQDNENCNTHECPIDGVWASWEPWQTCNTTCGGGTRLRYRNCTGPFYGGAECPEFDVSHEECNTHECPVDGVWELWSAWEDCSVTCGGGNQSRSRSCLGPFYGGSNCTGNLTETQGCNAFECPIDGVVTEWSDFYACSVTCGGGIQWRNRTCFGPFYGGANCSEPMEDSRECNTHNCPIDGVWLSWSPWESCSVTCGGGDQHRNRTCDGPYYSGLECQGPEVENRTCNDFHCPVDGLWLAWSAWDPCSVSCGGAVHQRRRSCDGPFYGGANCSGAWTEDQDCSIQPCPVDGVFEPWSEWNACSLTCGTGVQSRNRTCTGPFHGGAPCDGPFDENQDCNTFECPIDGEWTPWNTWSDCDVSCGGGTQVRMRDCVGQENGGTECEGVKINMQFCNEHECPVDGVWNSWQHWSNCSVTCGGGVTQRMRDCNGPFFGGKNCSGPQYENLNCSSHACPVNGVWLDWQGWSGCNVTCGGGVRVRIRDCDGPYHNGQECPAPGNDTDICGTALCPIPGDWSVWTEWSLCSATCDGGNRNRTRVCDMESYGNLTTDCLGEPFEMADCNTFNCQPLAVHCADWASKGLTQSCVADVDPDGEGTLFGPVEVECDFDSEPGKALTVLHHNGENRTQVKGYEGAGEYQINIVYEVGWGQAISIVDASANCKQYMRWECLAAIIHNPYNPEMLTTFWVNRTEQVTNYFGGATPESGNCACGETNSCFNTSLPCNCDTNDEIWRVDDGYVTNKPELPIHSFYAGDTGADYEEGVAYIGPVICNGFGN